MTREELAHLLRDLISIETLRDRAQALPNTADREAVMARIDRLSIDGTA